MFGRRNIIILLSLALLMLVASCVAVFRPTPEQKISMRTMKVYEKAIAYERVCAEKTSEADVNLFGNAQVIAYQFAEAFTKNMPEGTSDERKAEKVQRLLDRYIARRSKLDVYIQKQGCDSKYIEKFKRAYFLFSQTPPWKIHQLMTSSIQEANNPIDKN